jgi:hypothetical protein
MIPVYIGNETYGISFSHYNATTPTTPLQRENFDSDAKHAFAEKLRINSLNHPDTTSCEIYRVIDVVDGRPVYELLANDEAWCNPIDQFNKATGRKVALTKALREAFPNNRHIRHAFWRGYFERFNR